MSANERATRSPVAYCYQPSFKTFIRSGLLMCSGRRVPARAVSSGSQANTPQKNFYEDDVFSVNSSRSTSRSPSKRRVQISSRRRRGLASGDKSGGESPQPVQYADERSGAPVQHVDERSGVYSDLDSMGSFPTEGFGGSKIFFNEATRRVLQNELHDDDLDVLEL
jgi:hypothetical protein